MQIKLAKESVFAETGEAQAKRKVLVTGAAGRIGSSFAELTGPKYDLTLMVEDKDRSGVKALEDYGRVVEGKLEDLERLKELFSGQEVVLHLAAEPSAQAVWQDLHRDNVVGTYHVLAAARAAGVRRVVFASSVHAVSAYPPEVQVKTHEPVNPGDLYGVTKCFGEALGRYMAEREALSFIAVRIGAFQPRKQLMSNERTRELLTIWVSPRDLVQLFQRCIEDAQLQFGIFHGVSDNRFKRLDISDAREWLEYDPEDDAFSEDPEVQDWQFPDAEPETPPVDPSRSGLREET